jgi:hypothetical protein
MLPAVADSAECDQVLLYVTSRMAPIPEVMDVQVLHAAAGLASPLIPVEDLPVEYQVTLRVKLDSRACGSGFLHEAFCAIWNRNSCFCGLGKNR